MKIATKELLAALNFVLPFVSKTNIISAIACIRMKTSGAGLVLDATDLHAEARSNAVACIGNLDVCVNPALLKGFCERAGEEIDLRHTDVRLQLASGKLKASVKTLPGTDFPDLKRDGTVKGHIVGIDLSRMIAEVAHASGHNDVRYQLNGIAIQMTGDWLHVVATNGYSFAGHSLKHEAQDARCILPIDIAERLPEILEADILADGILFRCEGGTIRSKVIDAQYPGWEVIVKAKLPSKIECNTADFRAALDATRPFQVESKGSMKGKILRIECDGSTMRLSGGIEGEELTASLDADGDSCDCSFNAKYWQDAMKHDLPDDMAIRFNNSGQFSIEHDGWMGIIMKATV